MNRKTLRALAVLNIVLLIGLAVVGLTPTPAQAQLARAEYLMVSGEVVGRNQQAIVYIVDLASNRIAAVIFNSSNNKFQVVAGVNLLATESNKRKSR
jgi:hypothetical protein